MNKKKIKRLKKDLKDMTRAYGYSLDSESSWREVAFRLSRQLAYNMSLLEYSNLKLERLKQKRKSRK